MNADFTPEFNGTKYDLIRSKLRDISAENRAENRKNIGK